MNFKKTLNFLLQKPIQSLLIFEACFRLLLFVVFYHTISIFNDTGGYLELSRAITKFSLVGYDGMRSMGYPIVISLLNQNLAAVVLLQFALGICTSILWFKSLLNFNFSTKTSFLATIYLSSFINVFFFETAILVETLVLFLVALLVFLLSKKHFEQVRFSTQMVLAIIFGYLVLIKPFFAFLPFLFIAYSLLKNFSLKKLFLNLLLLLLPFSAYFGWCYVNKINNGYFAATTYYGLTNAQNCVYFAEKSTKEYKWVSEIYVKYREKAIKEKTDVSMSIWDAYYDGAFNQYRLTFSELSQKLGDYAKVTILKNPGDYAKQVIFRSWLDFWKPTIYWNYDKFNFKYANKICLVIFFLQFGISLFFRIFFLALIPYQIKQFIKSKSITAPLLLTAVVFSTSILQAAVTYGTNDRYSYPFEFMMFFVVLFYLKESNKTPKKLKLLFQ